MLFLENAVFPGFPGEHFYLDVSFLDPKNKKHFSFTALKLPGARRSAPFAHRPHHGHDRPQYSLRMHHSSEYYECGRCGAWDTGRCSDGLYCGRRPRLEIYGAAVGAACGRLGRGARMELSNGRDAQRRGHAGSEIFRCDDDLN